MTARLLPSLARAGIVVALLAGSAGAAVLAPAAAAVQVAPQATGFTLANGLEVVVIPDRRAPVVTHMVWYKVGAADEAAGENAFTSNDYTAYHQRVAKEHLGLVMAFEADRMENLILTDAVVDPERQVILEERSSRTDNDPSAQLSEATDAALYVNHPYGKPVIGWRSEMEKLSPADAIAFYDRYYTPNNAVLVVAGDVTAEEVRKLAEETYGKVARRAEPPPRHRPEVQALPANRLVTMTDERVSQPSTRLAWLAPSYRTAAPGEALDVLAEILGGGSTGRLYRTLVLGDGPAVSAGGWYQGSSLDTTDVTLYAVPRDGVDLPTLEARIEAVLADIAANGVTDEELARAKRALVAEAIYSQDSQSTLARIFGAGVSLGDPIAEIQTWRR